MPPRAGYPRAVRFVVDEARGRILERLNGAHRCGRLEDSRADVAPIRQHDLMSELSRLQQEIQATRRQRGFTTDPTRLLTLIVEELGEVARELKRTWSPNYEALDPQRLGTEIADTFVLLCALASEYEIDLEIQVRSKFFRTDAERDWPSADP